MTTALVWSERPEPNAPGLRDCAYGAWLSALVYGGFTAFPLGIYTVEEREALERSDDQPDETGANHADLETAIGRRYGLASHPVIGSLAGALAKPGIALMLAGDPSRLPAGHFLRRWQPGFAGGHEWCVIPLGDGKVRVLDPLAPNRYAGDVALIDDVLSFAYFGADYMRCIREGEFMATPNSKFTSSEYGEADFEAGTIAVDGATGEPVGISGWRHYFGRGVMLATFEARGNVYPAGAEVLYIGEHPASIALRRNAGELHRTDQATPPPAQPTVDPAQPALDEAAIRRAAAQAQWDVDARAVLGSRP